MHSRSAMVANKTMLDRQRFLFFFRYQKNLPPVLRPMAELQEHKPKTHHMKSELQSESAAGAAPSDSNRADRSINVPNVSPSATPMCVQRYWQVGPLSDIADQKPFHYRCSGSCDGNALPPVGRMNPTRCLMKPWTAPRNISKSRRQPTKLIPMATSFAPREAKSKQCPT